jgi:hypothetical protein
MNIKNAFVIIVLFIFTNNIIAQPTIEWQKCFGGSYNELASSIIKTYDGGYIISGTTYSVGGDVSGGHVAGNGNPDYWVVKLTDIGNLEWEIALGGTNSERAYSIIQTLDSSYIVVGNSDSYNGDVTGYHGGPGGGGGDVWIVKLTNSGLIDWQKCLGGTLPDVAYSIQPTIDGGFIIAGSSQSNDGDVTGNHNGSDYWIVKLTNDGIISWQKTFGGSNTDFAHSIQQTIDGGYIVAGYSDSNDGDVTGNNGSGDYWIVKLTFDGNISWQKSLGGSNGDFAQSIQQTVDGGYIVAGYSYSNDGDVSSNNGGSDYWVVKLSNTGIIEWQRSLGGTIDDEAYSINQTLDLGFIVAGRAAFTNNQGGFDAWIVKLDSLGNIGWEKSFGGIALDEIRSLQLTSDGGYIVAAKSFSNNGDVSGNHGSSDYWIVKLSSEVGITTIDQQILFDVFPNPTTNQINIKADIKLIGEFYSIYDNVGKKVLSGQLSNENTLIELGNLKGGIYFFSVGDKKHQTFTVVKE